MPARDGSDRCARCGERLSPPEPHTRIDRPRPEGAPCKPGDVIARRYRIRSSAGSGPLGWMYRATDLTSGETIALKLLSPRLLQTPGEKRWFLETLREAERLAHPNVVPTWETGEDGGRPFVAAQYVDGLTLRRIMDLRRQKGQRFTLQEVEPVIGQIAAALDSASGAFPHGNLKPDNVMVVPERLKLTDFGLAAGLPRAPFVAAQQKAATQRWLAPEFLRGEPSDPRADVFSLGVLLGDMLGGAQLGLSEKNPHLPAAVEAVFRRAVSPRPTARFGSAGEMAAALSDALAGADRLDDAGIADATTDPRLRIARALGAPMPPPHPRRPAAAAGPALAPSLALEPFTPPPPYVPKDRSPRLPPATPASSGPTQAAVAIGRTAPAPRPIEAHATKPPPVPAFGSFEGRGSSRAPIYAVGAVAALVAIGAAWNVLAHTPPPAHTRPPALRPTPPHPEPAAASEPPRVTLAETVAPIESQSRPVLDRRADKDRRERATADRRRRREEVLANVEARRRVDDIARAAPPPAVALAAAPGGAIVDPSKPPAPPQDGRPPTKGQRIVLAAYSIPALVRCPPSMQPVPGGVAAVGGDPAAESERPLSLVELRPYCIDLYEFPNLPGRLPRVAASFAEAEAQCRNAGKRLCSEDEWENACRGPHDLSFPYGAWFDPDACNTADGKERPRQMTVSGAFSRCKSGYGVWDLSGNAAEWTAGAPGEGKAVKGGHAARPGPDDRCTSRRKLNPAAHDVKVGFRCCAEAD